MLLRVRVALPDRPGSLGQVARTLGVAGADIVQVVVLERLGGRAIDDFTVVWPGGAGVERLRAGLSAMPGVRVDGIWRAIGAPVAGAFDAELLTQVAANPNEGLATLVDTVPALLAADWAMAIRVPADWAVRSGSSVGVEVRQGVDDALVFGTLRPKPATPPVLYASWRAPQQLRLPEVTPLRARSMTGSDGTRYALAPFGRAGLVLVVARSADDDLPVAAFHATEVDRVAQLVRAAAVIVGDRLDSAKAPAPRAAVGDRPLEEPASAV
ncbi:amino acid-binding protein [Catellatospora tritici]|uniref:amino acid-binding protein n=1 Tax=Catellatospora tritici TaxID=2851566 RepID=UPI0020C4C792|nr:amino acid-binding protein [Catellatospora tritici]